MDCLNNIVGIIETPTVELPNVSTSDSGLWLEDTSKGRIPLKEAFYSETSLINNLIPEAVTESLRNLRKRMDDNLIQVYKTQNSIIGFHRDYTDYLQASSDWFYLYLKPKMSNGGTIKITDIEIFTNVGKYTGNIRVYKGLSLIYDGLVTEFKDDSSATSEIPFDDMVYIAYQSNNRPRDFVHSGCCGRYPTHGGFTDIGIGTTSNPATLGGLPISVFQSSNYCNGIKVTATFGCDPFANFCHLNYQDNGFGTVLAKLVQQTARLNVAYWLITTNKLTAYAACREDEINVIVDYLTNDINEMLEWLPTAYNYSSCYRCDGAYVGSIDI